MNKIPKYLKSKISKLLSTAYCLLSTPKRGIALLIALGAMIAILIIASLAIYLITRGLNVTAGQTRYETVYEAAVATIELGKARAKYLNTAMDISATTEVVQVGKYQSQLLVERTSSVAITLSGTALKFARAAAGPGSTPAYGSYRTYYIRAHTAGLDGEQAMLEVLQRYTILAE
jgi:hypothetical protein